MVRMIGDDHNASFRMVLAYWDMAASLVTTGAIDGDAFRAAHGEVFLTFAKIHPFLAQLRTASGEPDYCKHLEAVVLAAPDAEAIMKRRRDAALKAVKVRNEIRTIHFLHHSSRTAALRLWSLAAVSPV
jgi:hypothetical protein